MGPNSARLPEVAILKDPQSFAALEEEWEDLYRSSPLVTPFQSWAWLYSWWESYGEDYELRLVVLRDEEGLLVGLMPLVLHRRRGFARLIFVGTGITEYLDVLARGGWEVEVAEAGSRALKQIGSWHVADLQQLRPEAVARGIFRGWSGPRNRLRQEVCPVITVRPWDEMLAPLSKNLRSTFRRSVRHAQEDGIVCRFAPENDAERAARRFIRLHREMWQGRNIVPEHLGERFESHVTAAASRMTARGLGGVREFWRDGEVIASHFLVFAGDSMGHYLSGATEEALGRYQMSSLFVWDGVNVARGRACASFDLLRGEEPYKLRWKPRMVHNHRAILGRNLLPLVTYAGYHTLRSAARRYATSEDAPRWVVEAKEAYLSLRLRAVRRRPQIGRE